MPVLLLSCQNSQLPLKTVRLIYHGPSSLQLRVNWQKEKANETWPTVCVCLHAHTCTCGFSWGRNEAADSIAIYIHGCVLKVPCFDQKYFPHFEHGKFFFRFVAWALFVELAFIFRSVFVSRNDTRITTLPITPWWVILSATIFSPLRINSYSDLERNGLLVVLGVFLFAIYFSSLFIRGLDRPNIIYKPCF